MYIGKRKHIVYSEQRSFMFKGKLTYASESYNYRVIWMKGKIIDVSADKGCCTVKAKHRKYNRKFFCVVHRDSKVYNAIELIK